jgi:hypothetical protein
MAPLHNTALAVCGIGAIRNLGAPPHQIDHARQFRICEIYCVSVDRDHNLREVLTVTRKYQREQQSILIR